MRENVGQIDSESLSHVGGWRWNIYRGASELSGWGMGLVGRESGPLDPGEGRSDG